MRSEYIAVIKISRNRLPQTQQYSLRCALSIISIGRLRAGEHLFRVLWVFASLGDRIYDLSVVPWIILCWLPIRGALLALMKTEVPMNRFAITVPGKGTEIHYLATISR